MPVNKKIAELKKTLKKVKEDLKQEKSIQHILGENITDEVLDQYIDYVINDILEVAKEENLDKWDLGRRILPFLLAKVVGVEAEDDGLEITDTQEKGALLH